MKKEKIDYKKKTTVGGVFYSGKVLNVAHYVDEFSGELRICSINGFKTDFSASYAGSESVGGKYCFKTACRVFIDEQRNTTGIESKKAFKFLKGIGIL